MSYRSLILLHVDTLALATAYLYSKKAVKNKYVLAYWCCLNAKQKHTAVIELSSQLRIKTQVIKILHNRFNA